MSRHFSMFSFLSTSNIYVLHIWMDESWCQQRLYLIPCNYLIYVRNYCSLKIKQFYPIILKFNFVACGKMYLSLKMAVCWIKTSYYSMGDKTSHPLCVYDVSWSPLGWMLTVFDLARPIKNNQNPLLWASDRQLEWD